MPADILLLSLHPFLDFAAHGRKITLLVLTSCGCSNISGITVNEWATN